MTLESKLQQIKERCEAATEGLVAEEHNGKWDITNGEYLPKARYFYAEEMKKEDALFFVNARTYVPMLLEMVEETIKSIGHHGCFCAGDNDGTGASYFCLGHELQRDLKKIAEKYKGAE